MDGLARLDIDSDRDGEVEADEPGRWDWVWGAAAPGAILLPDLDVDRPDEPDRELAEMRLVVGAGAPDGLSFRLSIAPEAAAYVTVYRRADGALRPVVGAKAGLNETPRQVSEPLAVASDVFWVRAHEFPGAAFRGVVEIFLVGVIGAAEAVLDRVLFRVAPWIMTPNTLPAEVVYAVLLNDNGTFRDELQLACASEGVELRLVEGGQVGWDRWIQDEIEFGYAQGPDHVLPVVCDGPRNQPLDVLAEDVLRGPDVGVVEVRSHMADRNSLDSFGNLEVSPPVRVGGTDYPLGRVVLGTKRPAAGRQRDREPALNLRMFLYAQEVQAPFEVYTDWLAVGHVDEIVSFVPASSKEGFQLLLASAARAHTFFVDLANRGGADLVLWRGQRRRIDDAGNTVAAEESVAQLVGNSELWQFNAACQAALDGVRADLAENLGLADSAFVEIPVAFKPVGREAKALAYFPDMVNHLVLGDLSVVPRPYGPLRDGTDLLEEEFRRAVPERRVTFIDDWLSYHELMGEVHCGTNVRRRPFEGVRWWEHRLPGLHDLSARRPR